MMNKKRSSFIRSAKFLLAAPLALALLLGNVVHATPSAVENIEATEVAIQLDVDQTPKKVEETPKKVVQTPKKTEGTPKKESKILEFAEVMPKFPGGDEKMMKFVGENLVYPIVAQNAGFSGRVVIRFVVQADGTVTDAKVMRRIDPDCDKEALRVVNAMPKWTPGSQNGEAVAVYFNLPILFRLNKEVPKVESKEK